MPDKPETKTCERRRPLSGCGRPRPLSRRGITAVEIIFTVMLLGVIAYMFVPRYSYSVIEKTRVYNIAHRMASDIRLTRRRAITTGVDYTFQLYRTNSATDSFRVFKTSVGSGSPESETEPPNFQIKSTAIGVIAGSGASAGEATDRLTFTNLGSIDNLTGSGSATGTWIPVQNEEDFWSVRVIHPTGRVDLQQTAYDISSSSDFSDTTCFLTTDKLYIRVRSKEVTAPTILKAYIRQGATTDTITLTQAGVNFTGSNGAASLGAGGFAAGSLNIEIVIVQGVEIIGIQDGARYISAACP